MAAEFTIMAAAEPYEGAGSSRKIRRRPLRRAAEMPYDRPPAAIQSLSIQSAAAVAERNGWVSKALRIIARSSSCMFPSVFQTRVTPPPEAGMAVPCTDENNHSCKGFSEVACTNPSPKVWKPCSSDAVNMVNNSSADGISEVEILMKQKTFTRSEFDRLTELLRSRTIETSPWQPTVIYEKGETNVFGQENENHTRSNGNIPTPAQNLKNQLFREDSLPSIIPYGRQISQISTAPKFVTHFSGISEAHQNGHILPRPIGRTAMHRMSRSPYFRAASATNIKVHDLGSPGPIRRLRQKSNLIFPSKDIQWPHGNRLPDSSTTLTSNGNESLKISVEKLIVPQDYTSDLHDRENEDNKVANGKEKTCQSTTNFRDDLPSKLTTSMLQGRALKSMEDIDWPKFLNLKGKDKLAPTDSHVQKLGSSISLKQGKIANTVESCPPISGVKVIETVGAVSGYVVVSSGKRAPFRISAPEDDFDLGDDDSSHTKLNTEAVMKASAIKGDVEFSFPVAPACSSFSLPPPTPTMPSPLLERSSLQGEQISAPSQTKLNAEAVMKASDKPATKGDFEFSFHVAPACSSFSLPPWFELGSQAVTNTPTLLSTAIKRSHVPMLSAIPAKVSDNSGFKFNASNSTTSALPDNIYPVNGRKSLEAGDFEFSFPVAPSCSSFSLPPPTPTMPSSCLPISGPAVIGLEASATLSPSSLSTSAQSAAPLSNVAVTSSCLPISGPVGIGLEASTTLSPSSLSTSAPSATPFSNVAVTSTSMSNAQIVTSTTPWLELGSQASTSTPILLSTAIKRSTSTEFKVMPEEASSVSTSSVISSLTSTAMCLNSNPVLVTSTMFSSTTSALSTTSSLSTSPFGFTSPAQPSTTTLPVADGSSKTSLGIFGTTPGSASTGFTSSALGFNSFFAAAGSQTLTHSFFDQMDVDEGSMTDDSIPAAASTIPQARFSFGSSSQPSASAEQMEIDSCTIQSEPKYDPRLFEDLRRMPQCLCGPMADGSIQAVPSTIPPARFSLGSTSQPSTSADEMEIDGPTMEEMMAQALALRGEDPRLRRLNDFVKLYPYYFAD